MAVIDSGYGGLLFLLPGFLSLAHPFLPFGGFGGVGIRRRSSPKALSQPRNARFEPRLKCGTAQVAVDTRHTADQYGTDHMAPNRFLRLSSHRNSAD
eukprot:CAMPEP_0115847784 /NCGR_PEP_ID=MMETSP0287-20121206/10566_1 /TAXON_ID=412157 /ORGANISM="Chrysochromulina rotalis, Strain UIO044" /LENGTH=96 /DNA_ID=CAMNT_0003301639 /DNA_START=617 /DNA_END=904 /DNA_ORIENTATION=+